MHRIFLALSIVLGATVTGHIIPWADASGSPPRHVVMDVGPDEEEKKTIEMGRQSSGTGVLAATSPTDVQENPPPERQETLVQRASTILEHVRKSRTGKLVLSITAILSGGATAGVSLYGYVKGNALFRLTQDLLPKLAAHYNCPALTDDPSYAQLEFVQTFPDAFTLKDPLELIQQVLILSAGIYGFYKVIWGKKEQTDEQIQTQNTSSRFGTPYGGTPLSRTPGMHGSPRTAKSSPASTQGRTPLIESPTGSDPRDEHAQRRRLKILSISPHKEEEIKIGDSRSIASPPTGLFPKKHHHRSQSSSHVFTFDRAKTYPQDGMPADTKAISNEPPTMAASTPKDPKNKDVEQGPEEVITAHPSQNPNQDGTLQRDTTNSTSLSHHTSSTVREEEIRKVLDRLSGGRTPRD